MFVNGEDALYSGNGETGVDPEGFQSPRSSVTAEGRLAAGNNWAKATTSLLDSLLDF